MKNKFTALLAGLFAALGCLLSAPIAQHDHHSSSEGPRTTVVMEIEGIEISDAWVRLNTMTGRPSAGYFVLENATGGLINITGVQVSALLNTQARAMLHQTTEVDGRMRMSHVNEVSVENGAAATFAPGGYHIMLHDLPAGLEVGGMLDLILTVSTLGKQHLQVPCKRCGLATIASC